MKLYTIGHSTHSIEEFFALLHHYEIDTLVDVRTIPKSRRVPWFNKDDLSKSLSKEKITYMHLPTIGGLRRANKDSINQGWHNSSFRGFADYMQTQDFLNGIERLNEIIRHAKHNTAIMCAEAVPWRCHRSLIADAEIIRGIAVFHIMNLKTANPHHVTPFAVVEGNKIYYPKDKNLELF